MLSALAERWREAAGTRSFNYEACYEASIEKTKIYSEITRDDTVQCKTQLDMML